MEKPGKFGLMIFIHNRILGTVKDMRKNQTDLDSPESACIVTKKLAIFEKKTLFGWKGLKVAERYFHRSQIF